MKSVLTSYLKKNRFVIAALVAAAGILLIVMWLSNIPLGSAGYAIAIVAFMLTITGAVRFASYYRKTTELKEVMDMIHDELRTLPEPDDLTEKMYQELLIASNEDKKKMKTEFDKASEVMVDYYTLWAHQIKTPLAAAHLLIQSGCADMRLIDDELFKTEQYVEMVLGFARMESPATDYVICRRELDPIVRQAVRKYSRLFIAKNIKLEYGKIDSIVLTDEKWLTFVIEQILSNAIKYTGKSGIVRIYESSGVLVISDNGIGIAPEDLPRVFEKGYTGYNGRRDKKSTGIGLYICKRVLTQLGHVIDISSKEGEGTSVMIDLTAKELVTE